MSAKTDIGQWWWSLFVFTTFWWDACEQIYSIDSYSIVWRKSVNFRWKPIFCRRQNLWHFQHGRPVQYGRESTHKSRAARSNATLGDCMQRDQHHLGQVGDLSEVWEKSAAVDYAMPNSKGILLRLRQHFVDTNILSTPVFCRRQHFVDASILSTRVFCRRQYFVDANKFCQHEHFCRRQYSVAANVLLAPVFCRRLYFL